MLITMRFNTLFKRGIRHFLFLKCNLQKIVFKIVRQEYNFFKGSFLQIFFLYLSNAFKKVTIFADAPREWQIGFQDPSTSFMQDLICQHNTLLMIFIFVITLIGSLIGRWLRLYAPSKSKISHKLMQSTVLEIIWTSLLILVFFVFVSFSENISDTTFFTKAYAMDNTMPLKDCSHEFIKNKDSTDLINENVEKKKLSFSDLTEEQLVSSLTQPCPPNTKVNWKEISNNWDLWWNKADLDREESEKLYNLVYPENTFNPYTVENEAAIQTLPLGRVDALIEKYIGMDEFLIGIFFRTFLTNRGVEDSKLYVSNPREVCLAVSLTCLIYLLLNGDCDEYLAGEHLPDLDDLSDMGET